GSGKTTLLCILGGLLRPTTGTVEWEDELGWLSARRAAHRIGWALQRPTLLAARTTLANVDIGRPPSPRQTRAERLGAASKMLGAVGLADATAVTVERLSGGEQQRVSIARVMLAAPALVLADEPTGHLDRSTSTSVIDALFLALPPDTTLIAA